MWLETYYQRINQENITGNIPDGTRGKSMQLTYM